MEKLTFGMLLKEARMLKYLMKFSLLQRHIALNNLIRGAKYYYVMQ